ncbi:hypothetical protein ACP275_11G074600 [Erythranthe tilingii]
MVKCRRCNMWGHNKRSCKGPQGQQAAREAQNNQENIVETQFQGSSNPQVAQTPVVQNIQVAQIPVIAQHPEVVPLTINANRKRQAKSVSRSDVSKQKKQKTVEDGQSAIKRNKPTSVSKGKKAASVSKENNETVKVAQCTGKGKVATSQATRDDKGKHVASEGNGMKPRTHIV